MRALRTTVRLLCAGVLAAGLSTGVGAATAQASVTIPGPDVWAEIWAPLFNPGQHKCLDVPNGSADRNLSMQVFHCHGYAGNGGPQRWFFTWDPNQGAYRIWNDDSGWCLTGGGPGLAVTQGPCDSFGFIEWRPVIMPDGNTFELQNAGYSDMCLTLDDNSGNDHTQLTIGFCDPYPGDLYYNQQDWALG